MVYTTDTDTLSLGDRPNLPLTEMGSEYEYRRDVDEASVGDIVTKTYGIQNSGDATLSHLKLTGAEVGHCVTCKL